MKIKDKKLEDYYQKISYKSTIVSEIRIDVASVKEQDATKKGEYLESSQKLKL